MEAAHAQRGQTRPTVFVVDDDESVRSALLRLFRAAGYAAEAFDSALAYIQHAAPTLPACLVLDVRMPGVSGLALQQKVRGTAHALPIVFVTGHGDEQARHKALAAGAVAVLDKPLETALLLAAVERALERSRPEH